MSNMPQCAAIILDMDGLLLDTESTYVLAWQNAAQSLGFNLPETLCASLAGLHYDAVEETIANFCATLDLEQFRIRSGQFWRKHVATHGIALKNGFPDLFAALAETALPYCLATNSRRLNAEECLRLAGVSGLFPLRLTRDHVTEGKPAPEIFHKAAAQLNNRIEHCWVIEDSYPGILAAKSAGAFAVLVAASQQADFRAVQAADLVLQDLAALADIIRAKCIMASSDRI